MSPTFSPYNFDVLAVKEFPPVLFGDFHRNEFSLRDFAVCCLGAKFSLRFPYERHFYSVAFRLDLAADFANNLPKCFAVHKFNARFSPSSFPDDDLPFINILTLDSRFSEGLMYCFLLHFLHSVFGSRRITWMKFFSDVLYSFRLFPS